MSGILGGIFGSLPESGFRAQTFTASGSFIVPNYVTSISAVCIGGGASGKRTDADADGGRGGDLRYSSSISVTPGETLTITVGAGGAAPSADNTYNAGSASSIVRASDATVLLRAAGGTTQTGSTGDSSTISGNIGGGDGGNGGASTATNAGGGGGSGGYSGAGGLGVAGGSAHGATNDGSGGAGAGGEDSTGTATAGGGTGIWGTGFSGDTDGAAGSKGVNTVVLGVGTEIGTFAIGRFGSGGGGNDAGTGSARAGATGAIRIVWNQQAAYPSTSLVKTPALTGFLTGGAGTGTISSIDISSINAKVGDLIILAVSENLGDSASNYTTIMNPAISGDSDLYVAYRIPTTVAATQTITVNITAGRSYCVLGFTNVYANTTVARNIFQGAWRNFEGIGIDQPVTFDIPSRYIGVANSTILSFVSVDGNIASTIDIPSPYTKIASVESTDNATNNTTLMASYYIAPNTNSISSANITGTNTNTNATSMFVVLPPGEYTTT